MTFLNTTEATAVKIKYPIAPKRIISFKNKRKSCYQIVFLQLFFIYKFLFRITKIFLLLFACEIIILQATEKIEKE